MTGWSRFGVLMLLGVMMASSLPAAAGSGAAARRDQQRLEAERVRAAKNGDAETQYRLGLDYLTGNGVGRNVTQAYKWIRLAAVNNLALAQFTVGQMDLKGEGTPRKAADAAEWFRKSAKQGNLDADLALAALYRRGDGVPFDMIQAANLYRVAADHNDVKSQLILADLYLKGSGVPRNATDAAVWFRRAAAAGSAEGRYRLALLLLDGEPLSHASHRPSPRTLEALHWLHWAADQGYAPAQLALAATSLAAIVAPYDRSAALALIRESADQGYAPALRLIGLLYRSGEVTGKDPIKAMMYLQLADQLGDQRSRSLLDDLTRELGPQAQTLARRRAQEWLQLRGL